MNLKKSIASGVTLVFITQTVFAPAIGWGEGNSYPTSQEILKTPSFFNNFQTPNMAQNDIQSQLSMCGGMMGVSTLGDAAVQGVGLIHSFSNKDKGESTSAGACSKTCTKPTLAEAPSCTDYGGGVIPGKPGESSDRRPAKPGAQKKIDENLKLIDSYVTCLDDKKSCEDSNKALLEKQMAAFDCQKKVLLSAVQFASQSMNQSITNNKDVFNKMNLYQGEVGEQISQVDALLGGDPELGKSGANEMQGLLGMQKVLYDELGKMSKFEAEAKNKVKEISVKETATKQKLKRETVRWAANCLNTADYLASGSDGRTAVCNFPEMQMGKDGQPVPVLDAAGNPKQTVGGCTPLAYIRGKVGNSSFITANGQYLAKGSRRDQSSKNLAAFNSLWSEMMQAMGYQYTAGEGGKPQLNEGALPDSKIASWDDLKAKYGNRMAAVSSRAGFDVTGEMQKFSTKCFSKADSWKNEQMNTEGSAYKTEMNSITAERNNLVSELDTGMSSAKKNYSDVISVLKPEGANIPGTIQTNVNCSKDPETMQDCFAKVRAQVKNLLEGEGMSNTTKTIQGGTMTPPIIVPCKGLNSCVTRLKDKRNDLKKFATLIQKDKMKKVGDLNQSINKNMNDLSGKLSMYQNGLKGVYDQMKQTFRKMGVTPPEDLKYLEKEQLKQMEGADKSPGPYEAPSDMGKAISGMMQPGLVDMNDTGISEALKEANEKMAEKKKAAGETLEKARQMREAYGKIDSECLLDFSGSVGASHNSCGDCTRLKRTCTDTKDQRVLSNNSSLDELMATVSQIRVGSLSKSEDLTKAYENYETVYGRTLTSQCQTELQKCEVCLDEGKQQMINKQEDEGNNTNIAH